MQMDAIWNRAKADLVVATEQGDQDHFLWEHAARVARYAERIVQVDEVQAASPDVIAVTAAALYHDAGWIARLQDGEVTRAEILIRAGSETHRERGAAMLERSLAKLLPRDSLARASAAIRQLSDREIDSIEGQVVCDADSLDEFGPLSLWVTIRRGLIEGKGVHAVIETWQSMKQYRYWDVRLKNSFRFEAVRVLARKRLAKLERLMEELREQNEGDDLL